MANLTKEHFCAILSEVIDKNKDIMVDTAEYNLEYDAVELTFLLKSIGFCLDSFDFDGAKASDVKDIEIEIRCKTSGILSKLSMQCGNCTCPTKQPTNNNSFWEIQGTAPNTPIAGAKNIIQDTSCNLLPEISRKTANVSKTMLTVLLQHYQNDFTADANKKPINVKQVMERLKKANSEKPCDFAEIQNFSSPTETAAGSAVDQERNYSTPLSSLNVTPVRGCEGTVNSNCPKIILNDLEATENKTEEMLENEKPPNDSMHTKMTVLSPKNEILSNELGESTDKLNGENERDIVLIKSITEARKQLDSALLVLKCNLTRDLSHSSVLTVTPESNKSAPKAPSLFTTIRRDAKQGSIIDKKDFLKPKVPNVNRRHSVEGSVAKFSTGATFTSTKTSQAKTNAIRKKVTSNNFSSKLSKADTPYPGVEKSLADGGVSAANVNDGKPSISLIRRIPKPKLSSRSLSGLSKLVQPNTFGKN